MRGLILIVVVITGLLATAGTATAGSFSVNPIRLEVRAPQSSTSVVVSNHGAASTLLQVRLYRWAHENGEERLTDVTEADGVVVTPPLFKLAGGGASQIVRIGFLQPQLPNASEAQWRVVIEEVPVMQPVVANDEVSEGGQLAIAMRLRVSMPLLRKPVSVHQELAWSAVSQEAGVQLQVRNLGNVTERLDELKLSRGNGSPVLMQLAGPIYLFPGEQRQLTLKADEAVPPGRLQLSLSGTPRQSVSDLDVRAQ